MDFTIAKKYADWYRIFLRRMKRKGLKAEDMPADVAGSAMQMHQNALLVAGIERAQRKRK